MGADRATIAEAMQFIAANRRCALCDGPPAWTGVFFPIDSKEFGAPEGKQRTFVYNLCARCKADKHAPTYVEKKIAAWMRKPPGDGVFPLRSD